MEIDDDDAKMSELASTTPAGPTRKAGSGPPGDDDPDNGNDANDDDDHDDDDDDDDDDKDDDNGDDDEKDISLNEAKKEETLTKNELKYLQGWEHLFGLNDQTKWDRILSHQNEQKNDGNNTFSVCVCHVKVLEIIVS